MRLETVLQAELCSGCGLCAAVLGPERAKMTLQAPGYLRPQITGPVTAAEDAIFEVVCPGSAVFLPPGADALAASELGPLVQVGVGYATDESLRHKASSGGAISAIVSHLIATQQAHFALQIGASGGTPWLNEVMISSTIGAVYEASGSRYAPSAPLAEIVSCLDRGEPFVVVGKPCDIAALRAYARHDARVDTLVVAMIAFMCGGIPSATGVKTLLKRMGAEPNDVTSFRFRGDGWPGKAKAVLTSGEERSMTYHESWGGVLSKHLQLRCKICADGIGMSADVVCADAWYGDESGYPKFDEMAGRSLVLARTAKGATLIATTLAAERMIVEPIDRREIEKMQPFQIRRTRLVLSRLLALKLFGRPATHYRGLSLARFARNAGIAANLESFLRMAWRAARGRLQA